MDFCKKALKRSEELAEKFLSTYMLSHDSAKGKKIAAQLNDSGKYLSHGAVIDADDARELGIKVDELDRHGDLWQAYWRLYCELRINLQGPNSRLYEGRRVSLSLPS